MKFASLYEKFRLLAKGFGIAVLSVRVYAEPPLEIAIERVGNGVLIDFEGDLLLESVDGGETFEEITPNPESPYWDTTASLKKFYRAGRSSPALVNWSYHGGQSNAQGEFDALRRPILVNSVACFGYQEFDASVNPALPTTFTFGQYGDLAQSAALGSIFRRAGADAWYAEAIQRSSPIPHFFANLARGGTSTNSFLPATEEGIGTGFLANAVNSVLVETRDRVVGEHPDAMVNFQFVYWDQVEADGGVGTGFDISREDFMERVNTRAELISQLVDAFSGDASDPAARFSVTNPDVVLFLRDVSDGQWSIGGGGVALAANPDDPEYHIVADEKRTFSGSAIPYTSIPAGHRLSAPLAQWNRWMAIREAHQRLTNPALNSPYYRDNIILIDADGIGTRAAGALSGDGIHFGGKQNLIAERFLEVYNAHFETEYSLELP